MHLPRLKLLDLGLSHVLPDHLRRLFFRPRLQRRAVRELLEALHGLDHARGRQRPSGLFANVDELARGHAPFNLAVQIIFPLLAPSSLLCTATLPRRVVHLG